MSVRFPILFALLLLLKIPPSASQPSGASQRLLDACLGPEEDIKTITAALQDPDVDVNIQDPASGQTALMASVLRGKVAAVEALLTAGADATIPEKDGYTPPHGAGFQGRTAVMKLLVKHGVANLDDGFHRDGYLPFHRACWGKSDRHAEFVDYMLESGLIKDPDVTSKNGRTCREMTKSGKTLKVLKKYTTTETAKEL